MKSMLTVILLNDTRIDQHFGCDLLISVIRVLLKETANTKSNSLPLRPGLVSGHDIGVNLGYLIQKARQIGFHPQLSVKKQELRDRKSISKRLNKWSQESIYLQMANKRAL